MRTLGKLLVVMIGGVLGAALGVVVALWLAPEGRNGRGASPEESRAANLGLEMVLAGFVFGGAAGATAGVALVLRRPAEPPGAGPPGERPRP